MERVSIIITTYKRKKEFEEALKSALTQTYSEFEIIVIDDNVDKEYTEYVTSIINQYPEDVIYKKNEKNLGGSLSRNEGIKIANGEYIAFLDDDDLYEKEKIEKQVKKFQTSECLNLGVVYCHTVAIDENGRPIKYYKNNVKGDFLINAMEGCIAATTQLMCKRKALEDINYFKDVPCKQDSTLLLELAGKGYQIDYVPEILTKYRENKSIERISGISEKNLNGELLLWQKVREMYSKVSSRQVKRIEFKKALKIYYMQCYLKKMNDARETLEIVKRYAPNIIIKWKLQIHFFIKSRV